MVKFKGRRSRTKHTLEIQVYANITSKYKVKFPSSMSGAEHNLKNKVHICRANIATNSKVIGQGTNMTSKYKVIRI